MLMPDVNILICAHRTDDPDHVFYRNWMEELVNGKEPFALSALVIAAFLRIVTHAAFPPVPTPLAQAISVIEALRTHSNCRIVTPGERHWTILRDLAISAGAVGKLVADAQHAAVAIEHGCTWVTRDEDFHKFTTLRSRILRPPAR